MDEHAPTGYRVEDVQTVSTHGKEVVNLETRRRQTRTITRIIVLGEHLEVNALMVIAIEGCAPRVFSMVSFVPCHGHHSEPLSENKIIPLIINENSVWQVRMQNTTGDYTFYLEGFLDWNW